MIGCEFCFGCVAAKVSPAGDGPTEVWPCDDIQPNKCCGYDRKPVDPYDAGRWIPEDRYEEESAKTDRQSEDAKQPDNSGKKGK